MALVISPQFNGRCLALSSYSPNPGVLTTKDLVCYTEMILAMQGGGDVYNSLYPWDTAIEALGSRVVLHNTWAPYVTTIACGSIPHGSLNGHTYEIDVEAALVAGDFTTSFTVDMWTYQATATTATAYQSWKGGWATGPLNSITTTPITCVSPKPSSTYVRTFTVYPDGHFT